MSLVLFLNIYGVLNSFNDNRGNDFYPECVARINKITDMTEAKIVLSTSWRFDHSIY